MRLSWGEIRLRASKFSEEWKDAAYEKGESQSFYNDFFEIFGIKRRRVASYEEAVKKLDNSQGYIDLFWKSVLIVEQKSAGRDLEKAKEQALGYFAALSEADAPRYLLVCDFQNFELFDLDEREEKKFTLSELHRNVEAFSFILGVQKRTFKDQDPVNIHAAELMGKVHDALEDSGYTGNELEQFLIRLLFCLFADDTGIFEPRGIFENLVKDRTAEDGSDLGLWITQMFEVLNKPEGNRHKILDEDLDQFPYVNGDLFSDRLEIPSFNSEIRDLLIEACEFSWEAISPAIFGSLFQSVMEPEERRATGSHYTTEKNILKVIEPLFLDELNEEFEKIRNRKTGKQNALQQFRLKLSRLEFLDPACGCGNFLVISYRELRLLEIELLKELYPSRQLELDSTQLSLIDVNQFHGIEMGHFAAKIAEVAMWMMDHILNNRLSLTFGQSYVRIPLQASPDIHCVDALDVDWKALVDPAVCNYVLGNPPFVGAKFQSPVQREQIKQIAKLGGSGGTLDYVCAWFIKAADFISVGKGAIGFVATNSITQGEQVAQFWPILYERYKLALSFAHRTFAWGSDARGKAHVHVIIVGLTRDSSQPSQKRLFNYSNVNVEPTESLVKKITPYLFDGSSLADEKQVAREESKSMCNSPTIRIGCQPIDGGYYTFKTDEDRDEFLTSEPNAVSLIKPYVGARELIDGTNRWILDLHDLSPSQLAKLPKVRERISAVRSFRLASKRKMTIRLAEVPTRYGVKVIPKSNFLALPKVSSERRDYIPIGWLSPPTIPSDLVFIIEEADLYTFGILTSLMHMSWLDCVGGRLKSDYRYSIGLVYNTFPWPTVTNKQKSQIGTVAQTVLNAREQFPDSSLIDLYDPDLMPPELRQAHNKLDREVDKLYRKKTFASKLERVELLFGLYQDMQRKNLELNNV